MKFLGNLTLNLWDCGGYVLSKEPQPKNGYEGLISKVTGRRQEAFMENYFALQRGHIFKSVELLIYVFDVESRDTEKDIHYYQWCLEAILEKSPNAKIFCLLHKMDLVPLEQREEASLMGTSIRAAYRIQLKKADSAYSCSRIGGMNYNDSHSL